MTASVFDRVFDISARTGEGLDVLRSELATGWKEALSSRQDVMVTSLRHYEALCRAAASLREVRQGLEDEIPTDLLAQNLRLGIYELNSIFGEVTTDELLGQIFSRFCIGK